MLKGKSAAVACGVVVFCLGLAAVGHAIDSRRTNYLTFSGPVSLPGVTLAPGTYTFELADSRLDVVRVLSRDRKHVYFGGFTRIVERPRGLRRSQAVTFVETPRGTPARIEAWYPIGEGTGRQFVYDRPVRW